MLRQRTSAATVARHARAFHISASWFRQILYSYNDIKSVSKASPATKKIIDVREPNEYAAGAIPSSTNISVKSLQEALSLDAPDFKSKFGIAKPSKEQDEVIFYCRSGVRSTAAAEIAEKLGYKQVGNYKGSWLDWSSKSEGEQAGESSSQLKPGPDGKIQGVGEGAKGGIDLKAMNQRAHKEAQEAEATPLTTDGKESESVKNGAEMKEGKKFQ
ncbi:Rhodanese-like domain-containing protein [Protomyces lactucae-debilis]|uniref:Rhodanese-like domain-containing protein n=1 Tax=Protomyces lactucae-debilis TaxID=2754530 RepID=A0A1Y2FNP8_PROLT|nr:Rhodanese-like domain-containing protein [Protomyces lactucae-debilis]ORY85583.1 Rhodanese-like domain-containing protein [Protomyces lactucae-debilis]